MSRAVHGVVVGLGGSISAEHGIGRMKRDELASVKSAVEIDLMRRVKSAFDPHGDPKPGQGALGNARAPAICRSPVYSRRRARLLARSLRVCALRVAGKVEDAAENEQRDQEMHIPSAGEAAPFSSGLVRKSPKVAPNGRVNMKAIQNKTTSLILVQ